MGTAVLEQIVQVSAERDRRNGNDYRDLVKGASLGTLEKPPIEVLGFLEDNNITLLEYQNDVKAFTYRQDCVEAKQRNVQLKSAILALEEEKNEILEREEELLKPLRKRETEINEELFILNRDTRRGVDMDLRNSKPSWVEDIRKSLLKERQDLLRRAEYINPNHGSQGTRTAPLVRGWKESLKGIIERLKIPVGKGDFEAKKIKKHLQSQRDNLSEKIATGEAKVESEIQQYSRVSNRLSKIGSDLDRLDQLVLSNPWPTAQDYVDLGGEL